MNRKGGMSVKLRRIGVTAVLCLICGLLLPCGEGLSGQTQTQPLTLEETVREALANNWRLKATHEKVRQADQVKNQARSGFLPTFGMTYGYTKLDDPRTMSLSGGTRFDISPRDNFEWAGTIKQPLFKGFAIISSYELARLGVDRARVELDLEKLDLVLRVKEAYFNVLGSDKALEVARQAIESLTAHLDEVRNFYEMEMVPVGDLLKAEVEQGNAEYELVKAGNAARQARAAFNTLLGRSINTPVILEDVLVYRPERGDFEEYVRRALDNRPEIRALDLGVLQVDQEIRLARSGMYPEAGLQYQYIKEGDTYDVSGSRFHEPDRWEVSAVLSWTFWEWGRTHYAVEEKRCMRTELEDLRKALEDDIRLEVKTALLELEQAEKNIPTAAKAVEQGKENLRTSRERYQAQVTTSTEVLDAQTLLTQAQLNYYRALYGHNLARARIQRALGGY